MPSTTKKPVFICESRRRLPPGTSLWVWLEQIIEAHGRRWPGPHSVCRGEVMSDGRLAFWLTEASEAERTAKGLVADDMLDVVVEGDPPAVWLRP